MSVETRVALRRATWEATIDMVDVSTFNSGFISSLSDVTLMNTGVFVGRFMDDVCS